MTPKVTFGIINYNRLFYLKSCAESLMESVEDYDNVEFICIDDNSREVGTKAYLASLRERGWTVINQEEYRIGRKLVTDEYNDTTHMNAFADALNIILKKSSGQLFVPLQGDMEFVRKGWLPDYVELFSKRRDIGCVLLDAQRKARLKKAKFEEQIFTKTNLFAVDVDRKISGAGDAMYRTSLVKDLGGWNPSPALTKFGNNPTSETDFIIRAYTEHGDKIKIYQPFKPPAVAILTDPSGTNARIRGGKRYGSYWQAMDNRYYIWSNTQWKNDERPQSIEELVVTNGNWELPIDENGDIIKLGTKIDLLEYEEI
tara:strand:+ start:864 stop:1805 length:942 start_codon:yes stop_codon:yes gene_type:complete